MSINSLELVCDFFEEIKEDSATGLTLKKIIDRAVLINDPEIKGKVVFEVERHHGILGSAYTPGSPLSSFVTFWPVYVFDPKKKEISQTDARKKSVPNISIFDIAEEQTDDYSFRFELINEATAISRDNLYFRWVTSHTSLLKFWEGEDHPSFQLPI